MLIPAAAAYHLLKANKPLNNINSPIKAFVSGKAIFAKAITTNKIVSTGALCATPGIEEATQKLANEQIQKLLKDVIEPGLSKLTASSAGLLI